MKVVAEATWLNKFPSDWVGEFDSCPDCMFNPGVGCNYAYSPICSRCGWNPIESNKRIKDKYGVDAVKALTIVVS